MKEKLKLSMKKKSNNFLKKIESDEEMIKAIDEHANDFEILENNDEIMCFYCRNAIKLNSYEKPYGKTGLCIKDLYYVNSIKATLREEFSKLEIKDEDNKIFSQAMKMIYNQGFFRIISCGHYFHNSCFVEGCEKGDKNGFNCPLCLKYQNILIPPLTLFHDKYNFLKSEKFNELFSEGEGKEKSNKEYKKEKNKGINLFNNTVIHFLITINIFKGDIKNYVSFLDNIYPYYKAFLNYFENIFYVESTTFHKHQQIDNIKNLILSLRLTIHDSMNCDRYDVIKFIKEALLKLVKGPEEKRSMYKYYDSYMHYLNIFEKIILSLQILFDYEEFKEALKHILYIILPYFCFGLYLKHLIIQKQNNEINEEQFNNKLNSEEFNKYLKNENKQIMKHFNSFLTKFCFIKLISDYQQKNDDIINNLNKLSVKNILQLLDMNDLENNLSKDEISINDIINMLPKTFDSNNAFYKLFSSIENFDNTLNLIIENIKSYNNANYDITQELIIQFSPTKFNFIKLDNNIFDFIEKNTGKKCDICGKLPKNSFLCLICGEKVCYTGQIKIRIDEFITHTRKCGGYYCIFVNMENMKLFYIDSDGKIAKLFPIYVNKMGTGPKVRHISNEFNLSHEKMKLLLKNYTSKDFHFK